MNLRLSGKNALITGSSKGIGFVIAKKLREEGCDVVLNSRNLESLQKALLEISSSIGFVADVSKSNEANLLVKKCINALNSIDILVCNVGNGKSVSPGNETPDEWERMFSLNLWSTTNMVEASWESLSKNKGVIVCISSICGNEVIPFAPTTYSVAKAALNAYVKSISRPLGKAGVRINAISPGNIFFEGSVWEKKKASNPTEIERILSDEVSLGRFGTEEDIANLVCYLSAEQSSYATGSIWTLDGGQVRN